MATIDTDTEVEIKEEKKDKASLNLSAVLCAKAFEIKNSILNEKHSPTVAINKKKKKKKKRISVIAYNKNRPEINRLSKSPLLKKRAKENEVITHVNRFAIIFQNKSTAHSTSIAKSLTIKQIKLNPVSPLKQQQQYYSKIQLLPIKEVIKKDPTNISSLSHVVEKQSSNVFLPSVQNKISLTKKVENSPNKIESPLKKIEVTPMKIQTIFKKVENSPNKIGSSLKKIEVTPMKIETTFKKVDYSPRKEFPPVIDQSLPKKDEVLPKQDEEEQQPKKDENTINKNETSPETKTNNSIMNSSDSSLIKYRSNYIKPKTVFQRREEIIERIAQVRKEFSEKKLNQFVIKQGNASYLIKDCMNHRINWKEPFSSVTSLYNFKWQQLNYDIDYSRLSKVVSIKQFVNHFEYHSALSNKSTMFTNFFQYCEKNKKSIFKYVPLTIVLKTDKPNTSFNELFASIREYVVSYDAINESSDDNIKNKNYNKLFPFDKEENSQVGTKTKVQIPKTHFQGKNLWVVKACNLNRGQCIKVVNSIEKVESLIKMFNDGIELGYEGEEININITKNDKENISTNLNKNISQSQTKIQTINQPSSQKEFQTSNSIPKMVVDCKKNPIDQTLIPSQSKNGNTEQNETITVNQCLNQIQSRNQSNTIIINNEIQASEHNIIISNSNQALNVVSNNVNSSAATVETKKRIYQSNKILIQKYIESPFLYKGRKCDMRIWVLITHKMKVYIFKEGHLKTCSVDYDINVNDAYVHITNYSFQKHSTNFGKFEEGNEVPFSDLRKFLNDNYSKNNIKFKDIMQKIKEIIALTTKSVHDKLNKGNRNYSFEIFGYDFMLDSDLNVFLIEINTNPGFEESSPWIKIIIPRLLDDTLRLTIDQIFDTKYCFDLPKKDETEKDKNITNQSQINKREELEKMLSNTIPLNECNVEEERLETPQEKKTAQVINKDKETNPQIKGDIVELGNRQCFVDEKALGSSKGNNQTMNNISNQCNLNNSYSTSCNNIGDNISSSVIINKSDTKDTINQIKNKETISSQDLKKNDQLKYKSPFPVQGYEDDENLWEYICNLNEPIIEPVQVKENKSFTGIKHLLKQKIKNKR